jgi:hypothetical protein
LYIWCGRQSTTKNLTASSPVEQFDPPQLPPALPSPLIEFKSSSADTGMQRLFIAARLHGLAVDTLNVCSESEPNNADSNKRRYDVGVWRE